MLIALALLVVAVRCFGGDPIEDGFRHPPDSARPWVYGFWVNGNITKEGITADLEALERVGLGGETIMDVALDGPPGPVKFGSSQWEELFQHTIKEAQRLGLEIDMHNAPGWSGSGGPWITPDLAMQQLVWSKTNLSGPVRFEGNLPPVRVVEGFERDIAVLAFPAVVGDGARMPGFTPKLSSSGGTNLQNLTDGSRHTLFLLPMPKPGRTAFIQMEFSEPFLAQRLTLAGNSQPQHYGGALQVSEDGKTFRTVREFRCDGADLSIDFEANKAKYFRLEFKSAEGDARQIEASELELLPIYRIESHVAKSGTSRATWPAPTLAEVPKYGVVSRKEVMDLSINVHSNRLVWDVPKGEWTVMRFGYTPMGMHNHPVSPEGTGLECDKMSKEAIERHFDAFLAKLISGAGAEAGGAFGSAHIDSWEVGFQNWTPKFLEEFKQRRGYDALQFLPAYGGKIVESLEISDRFFWDVRRTLADLVADNYAGHLAELLHQHGMKLSLEAYINGPFNELQYGARGDVPMGEFWTEPRDNGRFTTARTMASVAHVYGKEIVAAEAFTSFPSEGSWGNHPFTLKALADTAFCEGVNRLVMHCCAQQPWLNVRPGMTAAWAGTHYDRNETWWEESKPWHEYLARCQFLLRQGHFGADVCYVTSEGAYGGPPTRDKLQPPLPDGYNYDVAHPEAVISRMSVQDGRIVLPDGMSYRVLVLLDSEEMTPKLLRKIKELVESGATVVGKRPIKAPGLTDYPKCDDEVKKLAGEIWGECDGKSVKEQKMGKGRVIWGLGLEKVLGGMGVGKDFDFTEGGREPERERERGRGRTEGLRWIRRAVDGTQIYFVANSNSQPISVECSFRVSGKTPGFWLPDKGEVLHPGIWWERDGRTFLPMKLDGVGSVFVVFKESSMTKDPVVTLARNGAAAADAVVLEREGRWWLKGSEAGKYEATTASGKKLTADISGFPAALPLSSDWELSFGTNSGLVLHKLISWTERPEPQSKYFSGTATYRKEFQIPAGFLSNDPRVLLDLGRVEVIAEVIVNGRNLGVLWKPPFVIDVTDAIKPGPNALEVRVVNLWPNRLIGDEQLPEDSNWRTCAEQPGEVLVEWPKWLLEGKPSPTGRSTLSTYKYWKKASPLLISGLLGPVRLRTEARVPLN